MDKKTIMRIALENRLNISKEMNFDLLISSIAGAAALYECDDEEFKKQTENRSMPEEFHKGIKAFGRKGYMLKEVASLGKTLEEKIVLEEKYGNDIDKMIADFIDFNETREFNDELNSIIKNGKGE